MSLLEEGKANTHLTHLEELVLTQGPQGYSMARAFLLELLETLKGNSESHVPQIPHDQRSLSPI